MICRYHPERVHTARLRWARRRIELAVTAASKILPGRVVALLLRTLAERVEERR